MKKSSQFTLLSRYYWIVLISVFGLTACQDDELSGGGTPLIKQVRLINPDKKDSTFVKALPGTLIVIQGENLQSVLKAYFNDYEAPFNAVYNTANNLIITIPADAPTEATKANVSNKIKLLTTHGETTFDFILLPPPPAISSISNENALGGSTLTLYGTNFYLVQKIVFPGNIEVTNFTSSSDGSSISLTVPNNVTTTGTLKVITKYGQSESIGIFGLRKGASVLCNFDDQNTFSWGCNVGSDASKYPGNTGTFAVMEFNNVGKGDMGWWNGGRSINTNPVQWVAQSELNASLDSYAVKFEIFIKEKWNAGTIILAKDYSWNYVARYEPWKVGDNVVDVQTQGWQTVTIPLTQFKTKADGIDGTGNPPASIVSLVGGSGNGSLHFLFVNDGTNTVGTFNAAIDNIRVVKIK